MRGRYVVAMNDIIVPNVTLIEMRKNMINNNPRGVIDVHLFGHNQMPAVCNVHTSTNVEDFFRINTPFVLAKKVTQAQEIAQALQAISYMDSMRYNEHIVSLKAAISLGYIPMFLGVTQSYGTSVGFGGDEVTNEHVISATDLSTFMTYPFRTLNIEIQTIYDKMTAHDVLSLPHGRAKDVYGRQEFICRALEQVLYEMNQEKNGIYRGFKAATAGSFINLAKEAGGGALSEASPEDLGAMMLLKRACTLKVPTRYESEQEAVTSQALTRFFGVIGGNSTTFSEYLEAMAVDYFYETYVREDTGEFVFRRANWFGAASLVSRNKYQSTQPFLAIPSGAYNSYQKLWGGKIQEIIAYEVFGMHSFNIPPWTPYVTLGDKNLTKFGLRQKHHYDLFDYTTIIGTSVPAGGKTVGAPNFFSSPYYTTGDDLTANAVSGMTSTTDPDAIDTTKMSRIATWVSKYHHSYPYMSWLGFGTYFMAPLGSALRVIATPQPSSIAINPTKPFFSAEATTLQRIVGKMFLLQYRADGAYNEAYHLLTAGAGSGMKQSQ